MGYNGQKMRGKAVNPLISPPGAPPPGPPGQDPFMDVPPPSGPEGVSPTSDRTESEQLLLARACWRPVSQYVRMIAEASLHTFLAAALPE